MEIEQNGWIILSEDSKRIYDFTFSIVRKDAQRKWVGLWSKPNNWKSHYRKGVRCVKAKMTISTNTIENWNKIKTQNDLPKEENSDLLVIDKNNGKEYNYHFLKSISDYWMENFSYWRLK